MLIYIFIKIFKPITSTLRFKKNFFKIKFLKIKKFFKFFLKNSAGRNNKGSITIFSKGKKNKKNKTFLYNPINWTKKMLVVTSIFRNGSKLWTLSKDITGSYTLKPCLDGLFIGSYTFSSNLPKNFWIYFSVGSFVMIRFLSLFTIFSNVCKQDYRKYALSNGTFCQLVEFFYDFNIGKIVLPSKNIKIISGWSFVSLGRNAQLDYRYTVKCKAGYNYISGKKSKVRGVARNPVDHPHGGRTKTNKPEVSIWGWIAKRNK